MTRPPTRAAAAPRGFTLVELLLVVAVIGVLIALLLPAVQKARAAAARARCQSNLRQFGIALHGFHDSNGYLPAGVATESDVHDSFHTGFTYLLPYLDHDTIHRLYQYDKHWYDQANYQAVAQQGPIFYCPGNRSSGVIDLAPVIKQWNCAMPPVVGASDYVLCKGANAGFGLNPAVIPVEARGLFNFTQAEFPQVGAAPLGPVPLFCIRFTDIIDGLSSTFAIGEATGGNAHFAVADINNPAQPALPPFVNGPAPMDQAWGAASFGNLAHPWYAGILGVTAQLGLSPAPGDEPMNRRPGTPTIVGTDSSGYNANGGSRVSGFRSMHPGGCNFLYADGSVHFVAQGITPSAYRALSTYAAGDEGE